MVHQPFPYSQTADQLLGPTLATETLLEKHAITVDCETLHRWMVADGPPVLLYLAAADGARYRSEPKGLRRDGPPAYNRIT